MKTSLASALSVAGVVAAGAAAFALNTAVLTTEAADTGKIAATTVPTTTEMGLLPSRDITAAGGAQATGDTSTAAQSNTLTGEALTPESTQVAATLTTYKVGVAGSVVLDSAGGTLTVKNIVPSAGWIAEPARVGADGSVRLHFVRGSSRLELVARIESGTTVVHVSNESQPAAAIQQPRGDDDDEGQGHEDRDHEDDDHEDDNHEAWHDDDDD